MDRLPQKPLKLSNTEGNSDGSSVERLYQDFLGPAPLGDDSVLNPLSDPGQTDVWAREPASIVETETLVDADDAFWSADHLSSLWL